MKKTALGLAVGLISLSIQSNAIASEKSGIEELKNTPATLYDVGKAKLDFFADMTEGKLKNEKINKSKFKLSAVTVTEDNGGLQINIVATGKKKYLTQKHCEIVLNDMKSIFDVTTFPQLLWKGATQDVYDKLKSEITVRTAIIDKKDKSKSLLCQ